MAKRRKVTNMLGLAVLSAVYAKPMHPYEMATVLRERGKDEDMPIKWGSLYTVVRNLEKHGFLAVAGNVRDTGHPERTIYRITEAGRAEYADWVRELLAHPEPEQPKFKAALSVCGVLHPDEVVRLLGQRIAVQEEDLAERRETLTRLRREIPRLFLVEAEYDLAMREAELTWTRSLLDELGTGSFPGVAMWRAWHETGHVPSESELLDMGGTTQ